MIGDLQPLRYTMFAAERVMLDMLAYRTPGQAIVEIGAREGTVTKTLLSTCRHYRKLHVIDPWDGTQDGSGDDVYAVFRNNVLPNPNVIVHRARSQDVTPPDDLGLVVHDGDHRDLSDLQTWWEALIPGGILAVHDVSEPGWPAVREAMLALGEPWHEYRYHATDGERLAYGPSVRGLGWKVK